MLEATEAADASREDNALPSDDVMELNSEGKAVASDDATDATFDPAAPAADVMSPAADVMSPATEETIDPKSWAWALSAKAAKTRGLVKCILKGDVIAGLTEIAV